MQILSFLATALSKTVFAFFFFLLKLIDVVVKG